MAQPLDKRIAAAMGKDARATTVAALIEELAGEIASVQAQHRALDAKSKSATVEEDEADAAADEAAKLDRKATRLGAKREQLQRRHEELLNSESRRRAQEAHNAAKARRDELVEDLKREWPEIEQRVVALLERIEASDLECASVSPRLDSAEAIARGCPGNFGIAIGEYSFTHVTRLVDMKVPQFAAASSNPTAWPRPKPNPLTAALENEARIRRQHRAALAADAAKWNRYVVTPPKGGPQISISTRRGVAHAYRQVAIHEMSPEQVTEARKRGCTVELAKDGEMIGLPATAASI